MHINESSSLVVVGMEAELDVELYTRHVFSRCLDTICRIGYKMRLDTRRSV